MIFVRDCRGSWMHKQGFGNERAPTFCREFSTPCIEIVELFLTVLFNFEIVAAQLFDL